MELKYADVNSKIKKMRTKRVNFGRRDVVEYVDSQDELDKRMNLLKLKKFENPFKTNFWRYHLLNNKPTIRESYLDVCSKFNIL